MNSIARLNPTKISDTGYYFDVDNGMMFQLSEAEIKAARDYFGMPDLAPKYIFQKRPQEVSRRHYKVAKEQSYNDGRHRKRTSRKNSSCIVRNFVIGGIIFVVSVYGVFQITKYDSKASFDSSVPSYQIEESYDGVSNLENEQISPSTEEKDVALVKEYIAIGARETYSSSERYGFNTLEDENAERRAWVEKYCNIYQVNFNVVYPRLVELTNNFTNENYLNGCLPGVTCKGEVVFANSEEELILYYVRCAKQLPAQLGIPTDDLYVHTDYESSSDYASIIGYYDTLLGVDPILSYAIAQAETGWDSDLFLNSNNPAGLRIDGHWWHFDTKEEGFIELALEIIKYNRKGAYTIAEIGSIHAPAEDNNENWIPNVTDIYNTVSNNSEILGKLQIGSTDRHIK